MYFHRHIEPVVERIAKRKPFVPTAAHIEHMDDMARSGPGFDYAGIVSRVHKGFFPELHETESSLHDWMDYYSSYFQTYIEKDIKDVLNIQDEAAFIKFVKAVASFTGGILNLSAIAEICSKDVKTVRAWPVGCLAGIRRIN